LHSHNIQDYFLDLPTFARLVCTAAKAISICANIQVAVKKLPTAQVSAEALSEFKVKLQTLAFASSMCNRLCRLLGFIVLDGNLCLVMRLYQQSLQQLLGSSQGKPICVRNTSATSKFAQTCSDR